MNKLRDEMIVKNTLYIIYIYTKMECFPKLKLSLVYVILWS